MVTPVKEHVADVQKAIETDRLSRIGGSDAGTILGLNRWKSAYTLWAEMCGMVEPSRPSPDNERIRLGHDLEPYIASRWMEFTGKKCRVDNSEYSLQEFPFIVGHIDRRVIGESAGLEIKTTSEFNQTDFAHGEIEPQWYAQCVHYMAVTGLKKWYIAVLQYGKGFFALHVDRKEEEIENLIKAEVSFYHHVQTKSAPVVDGSESTSATLDGMWAGDGDELVDLTEVADLFDRREELEAAKKRLDEQKRQIDNNIKARLENAAGGATTGATGTWKATYKTQERTSIDTEKLKTERPEIYDQYARKTESRVLRIIKVKERKNK